MSRILRESCNQRIELEAIVLSAILCDFRVIIADAGLCAADFSEPLYRELFAECAAMESEGVGRHIADVVKRVRRRGVYVNTLDVHDLLCKDKSFDAVPFYGPELKRHSDTHEHYRLAKTIAEKIIAGRDYSRELAEIKQK